VRQAMNKKCLLSAFSITGIDINIGYYYTNEEKCELLEMFCNSKLYDLADDWEISAEEVSE
jgi:hypothetical protein